MNILIIKLSSLGDVLHNLPIVWDIRAQYPEAKIDWLVEESYLSLLAPLLSNADFKGIDNIIPIAMRRWKKNLLSDQTRKEWRGFRQNFQTTQYDVIIETQGLLKAAWLTRLAKRSPNAAIAGLGNATEESGFEPLVRWFYTDSVQVPLRCHAVERSRWVAAAALNLPEPKNQPQFYPPIFLQSLQTNETPFNKPYVLFFHATARAAKQWSEANWIALGNALAKQGKQVILPWGNAQEKAVSKRLSTQIPNSIVSPAFNINEWFGVIANAALTVGVDTGLTHLSAMMNTPTIELYCDSPRWKTEAYWSENIKNLGDTGQPPSLDNVLQSVGALLDA
ncbi:MAG: lipopolysaccharide heptosyltransferase I [Bdellovibrio sp.]|nr:lipopolysaccharide heptosyltransferase I [Methylotenera sp.]